MNQSMNSFAMTTGEGSMTLTHAIMLYSETNKSASSSNPDFVYASMHNVENFGTEARPNWQIAAGQATTREGLVGMFETLCKQLTLNVDFLPPGALSISADHMVWWMPACVRPVFFNNKELGKRGEKVPHPPLLFVVVKDRWYVFALAKNERPDENTVLHHAPYFNVYDDGSICTGSAATPKGIAASAIPAWEAAFFDSEFTHINGGEKKAIHPRGEYALWKELLDGVYQTFPVEFLAPRKATVKDLMEGIRRQLLGVK
jgi:PRTRC genetic system protein B